MGESTDLEFWRIIAASWTPPERARLRWLSLSVEAALRMTRAW